LLLALVLSVAVLMGYSLVMNRFFPPPPPVQEPLPTPPPQTAASNPPPQAPAITPTPPKPSATTPVTGTPAPLIQVPPRDLVIKTPYWDVTLSNRGAVATSWILKAYRVNGAVRKLEQKPLKRVVLSSGGIRLQQLLGPDCQRSPFG